MNGKIFRNALEIRDAVNAGKVSAREIATAALKRIDAANGAIGAFLALDRESVMARADAVDRGMQDQVLPLAGVPIAIQDNLCTRGLQTTCGSKMLENYIPPYNATVVERLEKAGAVIIGKTNCDEFAMGTSTENSAFMPTRNPYNLERVSGGSAAAVAAGMAPLALGSDTGGCVRLSASFCNVVGLKPTYGRVSRYGLVAYASSLDCVSLLAKNSKDMALILSVIAGHDERDTTSASVPVSDYPAEACLPVSGMRLGIPKEFFGEGLDPEVDALIKTGIRNAEMLGCELTEVSLPHTQHAIADYCVIASAEASSNLARFDGVRYGCRTSNPEDLLDMYKRTRSEGFGSEVKRRIMIGTYALTSDRYEEYYGRALRVRTLIKQDCDRAFEKVDALLSPVSPTPAFVIGEKVSDPLAMYLSDIYTVTANLAGIPAISVPCGFTRDGLPVGLQLFARRFEESTLLRLTEAYMHACPVDAPPLKA